jgi:isoaspartyl peptidase/L-asparaginase-like protein (Ntn-hydrolase superfamily)
VAGYGGVIALSPDGKIGCAYNTPRMARAYITSSMKSPFAAV